jgi:hypothetical protein
VLGRFQLAAQTCRYARGIGICHLAVKRPNRAFGSGLPTSSAQELIGDIQVTREILIIPGVMEGRFMLDLAGVVDWLISKDIGKLLATYGK